MTDLVPFGEESPFALLRMDPQEARELLADALGGDSLSIADLDRIKVPSGGGTSWEVPTLDGDTAKKVIEGVVIHRATRRAYWPYSMEDRPDDSDGTPDCQSNDGVQGFGDPGGPCNECPMNEFGSDIKGGPGKACKETRQLFVLTPDDLLPLVVTVPPASLANVKTYFLRLMRGQVAATDVVTQIGLEKVTSGKTPFSRVTLKRGATLDPDARARVREYAAMMMPAIERSGGLAQDET